MCDGRPCCDSKNLESRKKTGWVPICHSSCDAEHGQPEGAGVARENGTCLYKSLGRTVKLRTLDATMNIPILLAPS